MLKNIIGLVILLLIAQVVFSEGYESLKNIPEGKCRIVFTSGYGKKNLFEKKWTAKCSIDGGDFVSIHVAEQFLVIDLEPGFHTIEAEWAQPVEKFDFAYEDGIQIYLNENVIAFLDFAISGALSTHARVAGIRYLAEALSEEEYLSKKALYLQ